MGIISKAKAAVKRLWHWVYRDSETGQFISKTDYDKRDPRTTERERIG